MPYFDVVVIGSGFGGAIVAARLGAHVAEALGGNRTIHVVDKGIDPTASFDPDTGGTPLNAQGNRFRHSLAPEYLVSLGDFFTDTEGAYRPGTPSMNVIAGKGLGGGSLLYDGVSLRAPTEVFEQVRDGRRRWPREYDRVALDPWYAEVERRLRVHRVRWTDAEVPHWQLMTKRDFVFAEGCRRIGATATGLKLADFEDANEGWWNQGQRFAGRQDLTKNYLRLAQQAGVTFQTRGEVERIVPLPGGYGLLGTDRRGGRAQPLEIECKVVVVAAGCVASTGLLLRSRDGFPDDRPLDPHGRLGTQLSANGDYGVTGIIGADFEYDVEGHKGKPMSSFCPSFWRQHQFIIIPFYAAPLYPALNQISTLLSPQDPMAVGRRSTGVATSADGEPQPDWGEGYKERLSYFGARMLTMGCLALDDSEGRVVLRGDRIEVRWPETSPDTERRWSAAIDTMRRIYDSLGGELYLDGYRLDGAVNSSHPLGGCPMADFDAPEHGVVSPLGECWNNPNLFVIDGGIVPTALGVNPSLTIAAIAESIADRLIRGQGTASLATRLQA